VAVSVSPTCRPLADAIRKGAGLQKSSDKKQAWEPMTIKYVGDAGELLAGGTGKKSPMPTDPGEIFKEPGTGG
jgi:hypothetical protein